MSASKPIYVDFDGKRKKQPMMVPYASRTKYHPKSSLAVLVNRKAGSIINAKSLSKNEYNSKGDAASPLSTNIARMKVPLVPNFVKETYVTYSNMTDEQRIFMQINRCNTNFGTAISMLSMYSKGRLNDVLQVIEKEYANDYEGVTFDVNQPYGSDPDSITKLAAGLPYFFPSLYTKAFAVQYNATYVKDENLDMKKQSVQGNRLYRRFLLFKNLVSLNEKILFPEVALKPTPEWVKNLPQKKPAKRVVPIYLNTPFFMPAKTPVGYIRNEKYLPYVATDKMVKRGLGFLCNALLHLWCAVEIYNENVLISETPTGKDSIKTENIMLLSDEILELLNGMRMLREKDVTTTTLIPWKSINLDDTELNTKADFKKTLWKYYTCDFSEERQSNRFPWIALSIYLMMNYNESVRNLSTRKKRINATKILRTHVERQIQKSDEAINIRPISIKINKLSDKLYDIIQVQVVPQQQ